MDINSDNKTSLLSSFGAHSAGEIPVLIPNTEVKPSSADYTALRETRKVPNYKKSPLKGVIFCGIIVIGTRDHIYRDGRD